MKYYTGIGSRETPQDIIRIMQELGLRLACDGYVLRSGGAQGADAAFEDGAMVVPEVPRDIYIPWKGFGNNHPGKLITDKKILQDAEKIASRVHPNWDACSRGAKALHTRNVFQVLGDDLNTRSEFLICWAKPQGNSIQGGTRTAWEIAQECKIPCFNLHEQVTRYRIEKYLNL